MSADQFFKWLTGFTVKQETYLPLPEHAERHRHDYGPAVVPGKLEESWLVKGIGYSDETLQMPPSGKLPAAAIRDLTEWVQIRIPFSRGGNHCPTDLAATA